MADEPTFPIGAVVRLASGGPAMTVDELRCDDVLSVVWFAGDELRRDAFMPAELVLAGID